MPVARPTKPFHAIILTCSLGSGFGAAKIMGEPGEEIAVTDENRESAIELYMERGCRLVLTPEAAESPMFVEQPEESSDADNENGEGLADLDDADSVDELPIPDRYKAALKEAGIKTLAEAKAHPDLSSLPGISKNIANKINAL